MPLRKPLRYDQQYNEYNKQFYRSVEDYDWNEVTAKRIGLESYLHRFREKHTCKLIEMHNQGERFIDIGCGSGLILQHLPPGSVGIDINPRNIPRAEKYAPHATVTLGDAEELPLPDASFRTAICTETIEHLVFPDKALKEIHRVLAPGGVLIGSTPRKHPLWHFRFLSSTHYQNEPFHNEFRWHELRSLFADWEILSLDAQFFGAIFFFVLRKS